MNCSACGAGVRQLDGTLPPPLDHAELVELGAAKRDRMARRARKDRLAGFVGALSPILLTAPPIVGAVVAVVWLIPTGSPLVTFLALAGGVLNGLAVTVVLGMFASMDDSFGVGAFIALLIGALLGGVAAVIGAAGVASLLGT